MLSALRPLRQRDFALVWWAALVSNIGSWMQTLAVGILVTAKTHEAGWTGLVAAAAFVPIGLMAPFGGLFADRLDRRRWLLATTLGETAFAGALTLLAATGHASPAIVTVIVFGGGAMAAVGFPAFQAMLPDLVGEEDLGAAVSLSSAQFNLGRVVGPALAGLAITAGGYSVAFGINAASFVAELIALLLVRLPPARPSTEEGSVGTRLATGFRALAASPGARLATLLISVTALTASPFIALVPAVALKLFHSKATGTTVLVTCQGVGAVLGTLALTPLVRLLGRRRILLGAIAAVCVSLALYGLSPDLAVGAVAILLVGGTYIGVLSGCNTVVQLDARPELRGRMLGIYMMALGILYPVGSLIQGQLADAIGLRPVIIGGAAVLIAVVAVLWWRAVPAVLDAPPSAVGDPSPDVAVLDPPTAVSGLDPGPEPE